MNELINNLGYKLYYTSYLRDRYDGPDNWQYLWAYFSDYYIDNIGVSILY